MVKGSMAKQGRAGQGGAHAAIRIGATVALLLVTGRALADGAPPSPPPTPAAEQDAHRKQAMALHDEARELHAQGRYRAAVARLETALALDPEGKELVYNLALIHERLGEVEPALRYYQRYLAMETVPKERERIQGVIHRLEGARPDLLAAREASIPRAPPPAGLGERVRALGPGVIVSGAVGAAGLLTGVILGISALARSPGADAMTGPGVSADDLLADARAAHRQAVGADVALLIGLAGAGAAVGFYVARRGAPPARAQASAARVNLDLDLDLDLAVGPLSTALRVRF
jgi:tetratricopeptide (TPR) repeat protein